ncbi:hypothetical protein BGZ49_007478 [Haplosporangium sp. Z 27]|nr:hypothetical protein BGZ49_007478 [Haplosporangium sp. Z 27]
MVKFLPILLLSIACTFAAPTTKEPVNLPLIAPKNPVALLDALARDTARWSHLFSGPPQSVPAINNDVSYLISLEVGTPAQNVELIFDTGSSNLFIKDTSFTSSKSATAKSLGETFKISYGSGSAEGDEYYDWITIGDVAQGLTFNQTFGIATKTAGFSNVDGLVGFGPVGLTKGVVSNNETVPTPVDNLYSQGKIPSDVVGVYFKPITDGSARNTNGQITFGGADSSKYTGEITYVPITSAYPASLYWGIDVDSIAYGISEVSSITHGIVDTGTTLILLSSSAVARLYNDIPGAKLDNTTGLYTIPKSEISNLEDVTFTIGGNAFTLTPSQYLIPENQLDNFGFSKNLTYSWIADLGDNDPGLAFILGQKFLENYYSVYDTTNNRVGLAPAV